MICRKKKEKTMALNNNTQLYKKLSYYICICFCLFFVIVANLMRFKQLEAARIEPEKQPKMTTSQVYSVFFRTYQNPPKMIFLQDNVNPVYLSSVFSQINEKNYQNFVVLNCGAQKYEQALLQFLSSRFKNIVFSSESCQISQEKLKEKLKDENTLTVFILNKKNLKHETALKTAEKLTLKPSIKISEIKNVPQWL